MSSNTNNNTKNKDSKKTFKSGKVAKRREWQKNAQREINIASTDPRK